MAIELHPETPIGPQDDILDADIIDVDEVGRAEHIKAAAKVRVEKAGAQLAEQKVRVFARVAAWYGTTDVTDEDLAREIERKRRSAQRHDELELTTRIKSLRIQIRHADDPEESARLASELAAAETRLQIFKEDDADHYKLSGRDLGRARWTKKASRLGITAAATYGYINGIAVEPALILASLGAVPVGWWYLSRPAEEQQPAAAAPLIPGQPQPVTVPGQDQSVDFPKPQAQTVGGVNLTKEGHTVPAQSGVPGEAAVQQNGFGPAVAPALDQDALTRAVRAATNPAAVVTVLSATGWEADGTSTTVFDLPAGTTVAMLQKNADRLAGALGLDVQMIDVTKAGAAGRASLWLSEADPFEAVRHSPLMASPGPVDAWRDGIPVGWGKRGNTICLPVRNSHFLIGGTTRSGKGVGMANLAVGAALDVRINLRVVAGKENGEFDAYARSGVASTYFKQRPGRLLQLTRALLVDMDRRNRILGELGKSKLTPETIERLGGIELVIIDELATFTAKDSHEDRDELLENLMKLAAVATGAGILLVLTTQLPQSDVVPSRLAMNCLTKWAMRVDTANQSNAILGGGSAGAGGPDASKFDPPRPGLGWLVNPFAGITDLARSFDLDEDERGEVTLLAGRAAELRRKAGRLAGQWKDPIEEYLVKQTGQSSSAGGPDRNGIPGRAPVVLTPEQKAAHDALVAAVAVMDYLGRDAQLEEMAAQIGDGMTGDRLGELLRAIGAGPTGKITVPDRGRVQGYRREHLQTLLESLGGA
ncbi:FtsK/SpoIIIE domain-containing protein [Streptomyces virginiae]|uniref:FtsK/SpoIIIE domain-containing protein n=1 Tax=Streptomyces virginiae TaxID=1961 RepID=UPI002259898C|nr:FtsK/SpoIIIE domain-containing protein [Streptomyces virginiae]MCX4720014.1 FtsK/SpoIIIE domain-containing protein [Streptomyces virginiae]